MNARHQDEVNPPFEFRDTNTSIMLWLDPPAHRFDYEAYQEGASGCDKQDVTCCDKQNATESYGAFQLTVSLGDGPPAETEHIYIAHDLTADKYRKIPRKHDKSAYRYSSKGCI